MVLEFFGSFGGTSIIYLDAVWMMKRRRPSVAEMAVFFTISTRPDYIAPHTKKSTKYVTKYIPIWVFCHHSPITFKIKDHRCLGTTSSRRRQNSGRNRGDLCLPKHRWPWPTRSMFVSSFLHGRGAVSNVFCRSGAFIVSRCCTGNDRRDAVGWYYSNGILMVVYIAF